MRVFRFAAALGVAGVATLALAAPAGAIDVPNPLDPVGTILDKLCPPRAAPYPQTPTPVVLRTGGGTYAKYDYAGLYWTTWDAGCISTATTDTAIGSQINQSANMVDQLVNELQSASLDSQTTSSFDGVIASALAGLRSAFWNPYALAGLAACGLLVALSMGAGRVSGAAVAGLSALAVVGLMAYVTAHPTSLADAGNALTSTVATGVSDSLIGTTPGGGMPSSATASDRYVEGYYQVSYRAWVEGWSCGDKDAESRYGLKLLDAQAFTVAEVAAIRADPSIADGLVKSKQDAWTKIGEDMQASNPTAFSCWRGEGTSRFSASVKHGVVTLSAGFWILLGSVTLLALKWVLRLALLFGVTLGPVLLFSERMRARMVEFVLLGLLGPPMVAAGVGTLLWGYYAILISPQSWWQAGVSAFALGLALWFSKGILARMFVGVSQSHAGGSKMGKRARRSLSNAGHSRGGGGASGAVAGATAGAVAGAVVADHATSGGDDARRSDPAPVARATPYAPRYEAAAHVPSRGDTQPIPRPTDTQPIPTGDAPPHMWGHWTGDGAARPADDYPAPAAVPDDAVDEAMARARRMGAANGDGRHPDA